MLNLTYPKPTKEGGIEWVTIPDDSISEFGVYHEKRYFADGRFRKYIKYVYVVSNGEKIASRSLFSLPELKKHFKAHTETHKYRISETKLSRRGGIIGGAVAINWKITII